MQFFSFFKFSPVCVLDVLDGPATDHDSPIADGLSLSVLTYVRGRGHRVHGRSCHDIVSSSPAATTAADSTVPHRAHTSLFTTATAPPHHRAPAHHGIPIASPEPSRHLTTVPITRL